MHIDLTKFNELVEQKYLRQVESPCGKLYLYCYTEKCEYERFWTKETRMARGLIVEKATGLVIAKPFEKFFNLGAMEETYLTNLPNEPYTVQEKMDGSLGIIYYYEDKWNVATKGSFTSDQAIKATEMLKSYIMIALNEHFTYLVEIIYPENKIVVNYSGAEKLVLLGLVDTRSFHEYSSSTMRMWASSANFYIPKTYNYTIEQMIELQKTLPKDQEGFVVRYENGLRVKIKSVAYLRIHKIISQISPLSFWEVMKYGKVAEEFTNQIPDEFMQDWQPIVHKLEEIYAKIYLDLQKDVVKLTTYSRKEVGLLLKNESSKIKYPKCIFFALDCNKEKLDYAIMKMIRPHKNELE